MYHVPHQQMHYHKSSQTASANLCGYNPLNMHGVGAQPNLQQNAQQHLQNLQPHMYQSMKSTNSTAMHMRYPGGYASQPTFDVFAQSQPRINERSQLIAIHPSELPPIGHIGKGVNAQGATFQERVIEEGNKIIHEKVTEIPKRSVEQQIVEVPEIEHVTKVVEVPEFIQVPKYVEKYIEVVQERLVTQPKQVVVDKYIEVPQYEYIDIPIEKIIEVPQFQEEYVVKEVQVPQIVEVPVPQHVEKKVQHTVTRYLPVPVEAAVLYQYQAPKLKPVYSEVPVPIYVPRFVEVPVPMQNISPEALQNFANLVHHLSVSPMVKPEQLAELAAHSKALLGVTTA